MSNPGEMIIYGMIHYHPETNQIKTIELFSSREERSKFFTARDKAKMKNSTYSGDVQFFSTVLRETDQEKKQACQPNGSPEESCGDCVFFYGRPCESCRRCLSNAGKEYPDYHIPSNYEPADAANQIPEP